MKRPAILLLTALALGSGLADAARRSSGGGFGGSTYRSSPSSSYRTPSSRSYNTPRTAPLPRNNSSSSPYTRPRTPSSPPSTSSSTSNNPYGNIRNTAPGANTAKTSYPSTSSVRSSPLNTAAAAKVTPTQLSNWNKVNLPAGVPRSAITYSATPSSQYQYQLQPGRYYPYPQSYYRQHNIGYDILKYALIFTAVSSVADAMTPDVVVNGSGNVNPQATVIQRSGPNLWTYVGVGFLAAAAAWFFGGRRRERQ